ncbi:hypothetical protein [Enterococcus faecalis]|uniref:hypothetical protein n=1 Tax=Enterococcus faecalis TaxID=1351 RepID=UPI000AD80623|nr:hypothetical protein [Enterococcus faecalis]
MSKLNQLIGFLEEQLTVSEPTPDYTRHNQEIITYIEYLKSMKQPQLNENQQIVLDWLKNDMLDDSDFYNTIYNSRFLHVNGEPHRKENIAFMKLKNKEFAQVIQAFSQWALEQEEAK